MKGVKPYPFKARREPEQRMKGVKPYPFIARREPEQRCSVAADLGKNGARASRATNEVRGEHAPARR